MNPFGLAGIGILLTASSAMAGTSQVIWNVRAELHDYAGNPLPFVGLYPADLPPIDNGDGTFSTNGVLLTWTMYVRVTGDNQGLAGAVVSMGIEDTATGTWAEVSQRSDCLSFPAVYKAPGAERNGTIADGASVGGPGAGRGASVGSPEPYRWHIRQMGMGYLDWSARRYITSPPLLKGWVGDQQWGVGLDSRKTVLLAAGDQGTYDLVQGTIDITYLPMRNYRARFDLQNTTSKVVDSGIDLNSDQYSLSMTNVTVPDLQVGETFEIVIIPEPTSFLLLAGAALLTRRRRHAAKITFTRAPMSDTI